MVFDIKEIIPSIVSLIITIIAVFLLIGNTANDLLNAADNVSGSGLPMASLFNRTGIILILFMSGLLLSFVLLLLPPIKSK